MAIDYLTIGPDHWADLRKGNGGALTATPAQIKQRGASFPGDLYRNPDDLAISGAPVLTGTINVAYAGFTVTASGGLLPYTYSLVGTWPTGISVNSSSGAVSGTPTQSGTFAGLSVRATDADSNTAQIPAFTLTVAP